MRHCSPAGGEVAHDLSPAHTGRIPLAGGSSRAAEALTPMQGGSTEFHKIADLLAAPTTGDAGPRAGMSIEEAVQVMRRKRAGG